MHLQDTIKKQVGNMYLWPKTLEVPIMDPSKYSFDHSVVACVVLLKYVLLMASAY